MQVIVATTDRNSSNLARKMNINSNMIIANQGDKCEEYDELIDDNTVKIISTTTRGVGKNRNIGLLYATEDIVLLADDDIIYKNDYSFVVEEAFENLKDADVIIFQMQFMKDGEIYSEDKHSTKRAHLWNSLGYGTYQIAARRESLERENIHFTHLFGGGCIYSAGEDSLFLIDCFRKKLKVYTYAKTIGVNVRDSSSWFTGYSKKFFFDRGAFAACAFPKVSFLLVLYYCWVYRNAKTMTVLEKLRLMLAGVRGYKNLLTYYDCYGEEI